MAEKRRIYCSFCGKNDQEVPKIIAGPTVFVCNECVGLLVGILAEEGVPIGPSPLAKPRQSEITWPARQKPKSDDKV